MMIGHHSCVFRAKHVPCRQCAQEIIMPATLFTNENCRQPKEKKALNQVFKCLLTTYVHNNKTKTTQNLTNNLCSLMIELTCFRINKEYLLFESIECSFGFKHTNPVIKSHTCLSLNLKITSLSSLLYK